MKLYTEEQVKDAFIKGFYTDNFPIPLGEDFAIKQTMDSYMREFMKSLTPIELPSDEEIDRYARFWGNAHPFISKGAKWMRDKIQGGNK